MFNFNSILLCLRCAFLIVALTTGTLVAAQGGDTFDDAIPCDAWGFAHSGNTCDYQDNYHEACPYVSTPAPDVVYTSYYAPCTLLCVDLFGSSYDTIVLIYDAQMNLLACNDEYYSDETSFVEFYREDGQQIYIVVDGYGGQCGDYELNLYTPVGPPPYEIVCPVEAQLESEPELTETYVDSYNGGCIGSEAFYRDLRPVDESGYLAFCGQSGWYGTESDPKHDRDLFRVVASSDELIWTVDSEFTFTVCSVGTFTNCDTPFQTIASMNVLEGGLQTLVVPTTPGQIVYLLIHPDDVAQPACVWPTFDYMFELSGVLNVVSTESQNWGSLKSLYR